MARELFRTATSGTISQLLFHHTGTLLPSLTQIPKSYLVCDQAGNQWMRLELQYSDFQQAWCKFNLIARTCLQMNYHPEIFNVYNRLVIRLYTTNESGDKILTTKDLYISYFLDELKNHNVEQSHKRALEKVNSLN